MTLSELGKELDAWMNDGLTKLMSGDIGEFTIGQGMFTLVLIICAYIAVSFLQSYIGDVLHRRKCRKD